MKCDARISLSAVIAFGALLCAPSPSAHAVDTTQNSQHTAAQAAALREAAQMVPGAIELRKALDSRTVRPGQTFQARLDQTVHLKNGPELKSGTILLGEVTADKTQNGKDRLSLRFTEARLKGGKTVPIKATVIEVAPPAFNASANLANDSGLWNPQTLRVDQLGVLRDVDMHSNIASRNSVTFVSEDNHDVKLASQSQMFVAIAPQPAAQSSSGNGGM